MPPSRTEWMASFGSSRGHRAEVKRTGQKHLVQCQCILPQYRKAARPIFHKFMVFSVLSEGVVEPKYVQCNNCGIVHKVYDLCKSEIVTGRDELRSVSSKEELALGVPPDLRGLLDTYGCDLPIWEHIKFILDEGLWGEQVVLTRETVNGEVTGKILTVAARDRFTLENYISRETLE